MRQKQQQCRPDPKQPEHSREKLFALKDEKYAAFSASLVPNVERERVWMRDGGLTWMRDGGLGYFNFQKIML